MSDYKIGFVYVLKNLAMPNLLKIGFTYKLTEDRSLELHTTGVPFPFETVFQALTSNPKKVEKIVHSRLKDHRVNKKREFFQVSAEIAVKTLRESLIEISGIKQWETSQHHILKAQDRISITLEAGQIFVIISHPSVFESARIMDTWQAHSTGDCMEFYAVDSSSAVAGLSNNDARAAYDPVPSLSRGGEVPNGYMNGREFLVPGDRLLWIPAPYRSVSDRSVIFEAHSYVQLVSRTWTPVIVDRLPLMLNNITHKEYWDDAYRDIQHALQLPIARRWAQRVNRGTEWTTIALEDISSEEWLHPPCVRGVAARIGLASPGA